MGVKGPIPKRDDERVRRNTTGEDGLETKNFSMSDPVKIPDAFFENDEVQGMWAALQISVNVQYFEPTDWAYAIFVLTRIDRGLAKGEPGAMMMSAWDGLLKQLAMTETERRRIKIEAHRGVQAEEETQASDYYEKMFEKQRERFTA
jgi:hypothetical protein